MKHVHFIGIAGSGASAIAHIAESEGFKVTGCDKTPHNEFTKDFSPEQLKEGHSAEHLNLANWPASRGERISELANQQNNESQSHIISPSPLEGEGAQVDILAISPAITSLDPNNEEVKKAKELGIEVLTWQEFMGKYLEKDKFVIAVCGTHGKSTTTAMIAQLLEEAGLDPTVELGAVVNKWGTNYRIKNSEFRIQNGNRKKENSEFLTPNSEFFITEADEFNNNFLVSQPDITVINNLDMDHPEFFKDFQDYTDSFEKFLLQNKGTIVANLADKNVAELMKWIRKHSNSECLDYSKHELTLDLKVPGEFNKLNAKAAFQVGLLLNIEPQIIIKALNEFTGIGRRQEYLGEVYNHTKVYTDFAHHPTEIKVTVDAFREKFPDNKLWVIFQPHMFSRTKALFPDFVKVLRQLPADGVFITDIFKSRENDPGDMNSKMLVEAIQKESAVSVPSVLYVPSTQKAIQSIESNLTEKDVILFIGAGDIDKVARKWLKG